MQISKARREHWERSTRDGPFNRWLSPQIMGPDGTLDLDRLHIVALRYGIDRREQYAHLNPGQQRMNIGNLLRRAVPADLYAHEPHSRPSLASVDSPGQKQANPIERASVVELLRLHSEVMSELQRREIVRTSNNPAGDFAELLFSTAFGWALEGSSASGHDATDRDGFRYQIKSRRLVAQNGSRQLSFLRKLPEKKFDYLAGVLFDHAYRVTRAIIMPHETVHSRGKYNAHSNGWILRLDDDCWNAPGVRDVTAELREAAEAL